MCSASGTASRTVSCPCLLPCRPIETAPLAYITRVYHVRCKCTGLLQSRRLLSLYPAFTPKELNSVWKHSCAADIAQGACSSAWDEKVTPQKAVCYTVGRGQREGDQVILLTLEKAYRQGFKAPPVRAVAGLSFGIPAGQCFGLLGVNGAGKTTAFRILTGTPSNFALATSINKCFRTSRSCRREE